MESNEASDAIYADQMGKLDPEGVMGLSKAQQTQMEIKMGKESDKF